MSELKGMKVFSVADVQDDGSFFVKKSVRDGSLAVFDEINDANKQVKINNCDDVVRECFLVSRERFFKAQDRIAQLENELQAKTDFLAIVVEEKQKLIDDKAELVGIITNLVECKGILTSDKQCVIDAKKAIFMHKHGLGEEDMKGSNREDVA